MQLSRRDLTDLSRSVGGLLFAVGAVLVLVRKSGHHEWGGFARVLVVLVPAVVLYALALGGSNGPPGEGRADGAGARPWESVLMVAALLLVPVTLLEFLRWVGASTQHSLYEAAVFALTALLAGYGARRARVSYAVLLAGLALLVAWQDVWQEILGHPSTGTSRWLLVAAAVLLLAGAGALARAKAIGARELATAGGIAAVAAGVLGVIVGAFVGVFRSITTLGGAGGVISSSSHRISSGARIYSRRLGVPRRSVSQVTSVPRGSHPHPFSGSGASRVSPGLANRLQHARPARPAHPLSSLVGAHTSGLQHFGWDLYLLVVSLALVWVGARVRSRGLGYVGGVGLLAFLVSTGVQITRLETGREPTASIVGWPLALLVIGIVGLVVPALYRRDP
ncbi:MAG TPA: hypothetical protein VIJ66_02665 [Solirubrobacteraceae bacterium]